MEQQSTLLQTTASSISFWKTKEGKWGKVIAAVLGAAFLYALYLILPFLITLATNLITLIGLCIIIGMILYMIFDKDIQNTAFYAYKMLVRAIRKGLINTDPIAIINTYIEYMEKQFDIFADKIKELSGARNNVQDQINKLKEDLDNQLSMANQGKKQNMDPQEIAIREAQAQRDKDMITRFQATLTKLTMMNNMLNEMRKACKLVIMDKQNQVKMLTIERSTMQTASSAWTSAFSVLKGDPNKKYFYDEAVSAIETDISMKKGIIDQYMLETGEIMTSVNMQNGALTEKGQNLLERWQKDGINALLSDTSSAVSVPATGTAIKTQYAVVENVSTPSNTDNKYKSILNK